PPPGTRASGSTTRRRTTGLVSPMLTGWNNRSRTALATVMRVEIWSDVICPWYYIGKARFEAALAGFEHRDQVEVVHRSFELDPAPHPVQPLLDMLTSKYGPQAAEMEDRVAGLAAAEGLAYRTDREVGNTFDAHRLMHLARDHGRAHVTLNALYQANFAEARSVFTTDALVGVATSAGLDADEVRRV